MADALSPSTSWRPAGRLVASPTDLGAAFPHGGTDLGEVLDIDFATEIKDADVESEVKGGEIVETVVACERAQLQVVLGAMTTAMLAKVLDAPDSDGGSYAASGGDGGTRLGSSREFVLLYAPRRSTEPGLLMFRAMPMWGRSSTIHLGIRRAPGALVTFKGIRHATKGTYQLRPFSALEL